MNIRHIRRGVGRWLVAVALSTAAIAAPAGAAAPQAVAAAGTNPAVSLHSWTKTWGGTGAGVEANRSAIDRWGNLYVAGEYAGTVDFDPAGPDPSATRTSHFGTWDAFLSKFDASGTLQWVRTWGGGSSADTACFDMGCGRDSANGVAVDAQGNVFAAGLYQNTVDFGDGNPQTSNAPDQDNNIFLSKFAPDGTLQWVRTWGGTQGGEGYNVVVDPLGDAYVQGDWSTRFITVAVDFNPTGNGSGHSLHYNHGFYDAFTSKWDSSGNFQWANTWGGEAYDDGTTIGVDAAGHVYVGGMYASLNINFDPANGNGGLGHPANVTAGGDVRLRNVDVFLSQFDANGNFQWVRTWGGLDVDDAGEAVLTDQADNVYLAGRFSCAGCNFNAGPSGPADNRSAIGGDDAFLVKYQPDGTYLWGRTWGGPQDDQADSLAVDGANQVYAGGYFSGTVNFDPLGAPDSHITHGDNDAFFTKFDPGGAFQWAKTWGGSADDVVIGLASDGASNTYLAGNFDSPEPVNFDPGGTDFHTRQGNIDAYESRFAAETPLTPAAGGTVTFTTGVTTTLAFPPEPSAITVTQSLTSTQPVSGGLTALGPALVAGAFDSGGAPVTSVAQPFTVTVQMTAAQEAGFSANTLQLCYWNAGAGQWVAVPTVEDALHHTLTASATTLGLWAVFGTAAGTATATPTASPTASPTGTNTATPTATSTTTATPTASPTASPTGTNTATPTTTGTATATSTATATPTASPTASPTGTRTATPTATGTATATSTATATPTASPTASPTGTRTATPTATGTATATSTATATPTASSTASPTGTRTATPTGTASKTPTGVAHSTSTSTATSTAGSVTNYSYHTYLPLVVDGPGSRATPESPWPLSELGRALLAWLNSIARL